MLEMFLDRVINFMLFWGIWILAPLMIDVSTALIYIATIFIYPESSEKDQEKVKLDFYPLVSVIVPVHNSADTLYNCLKSIENQNYPTHLIEVVCVNNGSQDNSFEVFSEYQHESALNVSWSGVNRAGKSIALNAGLYMCQGNYILNVDSDCHLDQNAILQMVYAFDKNPDMVAATGSIRIDKKLGQGYEFIDIIHYCEAIEYLVAFHVGRRYQSLTNTLFTLSGAFSAFRRDVILGSFMYSEQTVSEDTELTFHIREKTKSSKGRIGCVSRAIAYVEPISTLSRLYSQRVRWQRGQLEVAAIYSGKIKGGKMTFLEPVNRILLSDHTLALSRLTWTFMIPFLYVLGYPLQLVMAAMMGMLFCYSILDSMYFFIAYKGSSKEYKSDLKKIWWVVFFLPAFRFVTYWFRLGGIIITMTEQGSWKVENPFLQTRQAIDKSISSIKVLIKKR